MRVELLAPLTHEGVAYAAGATVELDAERARWLIGIGGARAVRAANPVLDGTVDVPPAEPTKSRRKGD
jgi:hypothetical protein